jgi:hypothetical protein
MHYSEVVEKVLNPDRYLTVLTSFADTFWSFGNWAVNPVIPLLIFLCVRGIDRATVQGFGWLACASTMAIVLAGYFAVYVLAPYDLKWFLDGSAPRLFLQWWPSSLLLAGLVAVQ